MLAWSWWEILFLPLGDSHDGRINGRFGLQLRNLSEDGLAGSGFLSSIEPFSSQPYAYHPPLINVVHAMTEAVLGRGEWQLHLIGFVSGLLTVVALLWLARELGFRPLAALGAVALVVGTPMFWIYARLGFGIAPILVFLALWVRSGRDDSIRRWMVGAGVVVAFSSWTAAALVLLVGTLGLRDTRRRPDAIRVLTGAAIVVALTLTWAMLVSSSGELVAHTASRVRSPVGLGAFVDQYRWFYRTLFPFWFRWLIPIAISASLVSARTRAVSGAMLAVVAAWTIGLPEAAFVHDYWTYPLLASVALGWMVMLGWLADQAVSSAVVGAAVVILAVSSFSLMQQRGYREAYFQAPAAAGQLLRVVDPPPGQEVAWVIGIDLPRWVSYYWDLPVLEIGSPDLSTAPEDDLVLLRLDRVPTWIDRAPISVATEGRYALIRVGSLSSSLNSS